MEIIIADFILILNLAVLVWEDFKNREISLFFLATFFLLSVIKSALGDNSIKETFLNIGINSAFLVFNFLIVFIYFSLKRKRIISFTDQILGLGDIIFLVIVTTLLNPLNFFAFFFSSLILSLLIEVFRIFILKEKRITVPFVSYMGFVFSVFLVISHFTNK